MRIFIKDKLPIFYIWCIENLKIPECKKYCKEEKSMWHLYNKLQKIEDLKEKVNNFSITLKHYIDHRDAVSKEILDNILNKSKSIIIRSETEIICDRIINFYNLNGFLPNSNSSDKEEKELGRSRFRLVKNKFPKFIDFLEKIGYKFNKTRNKNSDIIIVRDYIRLNHQIPQPGSSEYKSYRSLTKLYGLEKLETLIPEIKQYKKRKSFKEKVEEFKTEYVVGKKRPPKDIRNSSSESSDYAWYRNNFEKLQKLGISFEEKELLDLEELLQNLINFVETNLRFPNPKIHGESERELYNALIRFKKHPKINNLRIELKTIKFRKKFEEHIKILLKQDKFYSTENYSYYWIKNNINKYPELKNLIITFKLYKGGDPKATEIINLLKEKLGIN